MTTCFYITNEQLQEASVLFGQRFPERVQQVIETAENAWQGRFKLPYTMAADRWVEHGSPPDWLYNPTEDLEYTWILNRHWHLRDVGIAYLLTKDERYVQTFQAHVRSWIRQNPAPVGLSYEEAVYFQRPGPWRLLEVGLRVQSWIWGYMLMCHSAELELLFLEELEASLAEQAAHLSRYLGETTINHATMHMQGLYTVGTFLEGHPAASYWRQLARERLLLCLQEQIRPDGIQEELTPHYHTGSLEMFGTPFWLAKQTGRDFPPRYEAKLREMVAFSLATIRTDGTSIPLADSDSSLDVPAKVGFIGAIVGDVGIVRQGEMCESLLWLLGKDAYLRLLEEVETEARDVQLSSVHFPDSGYYALRDRDNYVFFDSAPLGGAHGHADALHVEWMHKGQLIFGDCGRYTYQEGAWRRYFKGTAAHNTVLIDEEDQTPYLATQKWGTPEAEVTVHRNVNNEALELVDASHSGYLRLPEPILHRRWLVKGKNVPFLLLVDWLDGEGTHQAEQLFHLAARADVDLSQQAGKQALVQAGAESVRFHWVSAGLHDVTLGIKEGWRSASYGSKQAIPVLVCQGAFTDRAVIATVCMPEGAGWKVERIEVLQEQRTVKVYLSRARGESAIIEVEEERIDFRL
ncbi:alginate lyase family protein [Paenibacillus ferrarius]|uniref:alginate lyase family protein n=1 Tax=Paenibacillus ferrarius TaxID=1469647 RepID=UPI003D269B85